jgi:Holliday junction resolvase RusA-like endonuclease
MYLVQIDGDPIPQKQTRKGKNCFYDPSKSAKEMIQWQVRPYAPTEPLTGPVQMFVTFYFKPPKSASGIRRRQMLNHVIHHIKRPDVDNCAYLVTNALKNIFYVDDSQIIDLVLSKRFAEKPKTIVKIMPIEEIAPTRGIECA